MDFLDKLGETITAKGREVSGKAKDMAEIANLKSQINTCEDPEKAEKLKKELALVENELRQKDNDGYRRSHTVFSNI